MESRKLVSIKERLWISENAVVEYGTNVKYRVMDVSKVAEMLIKQRQKLNLPMWIDIRPISPDMHKMPNKVATFQKDPRTGVYYGIPIGEDSFGNIRWQKIQLHDSLPLNLEKDSDAKIWAVIRFHPDLQGSPWQNDNPYYMVYDPYVESVSTMDSIQELRKAFKRIDELEKLPIDMLRLARYLGIDLRETSTINVIKSEVYKWAKERPTTFNRMWEDKKRALAEVFATAYSLGIITNEINKGYMYKTIPLGVSREEAINKIEKDDSVRTGIINESKARDVLMNRIAKEGTSKKLNKKEGVQETLK